MSVFQQLTKEEIREAYDHIGWFYMCPIYARLLLNDEIEVQERNWIPEWWFTAQHYLHGLFAEVIVGMGGEPPMFPFRLKEMK